MLSKNQSYPNVGMFAGPRGVYGKQGTGPAFEEQARRQFNRPPEPNYSGAGFYWNGMPFMYQGTSDLSPYYMQTGSNLNAVEAGAFELGVKAGLLNRREFNKNK